jgi:hypothetical protein
MGYQDHFLYELGSQIDVPWRAEKITLTASLRDALPAVRSALIIAALRCETVTYKELGFALDGRITYRKMGDLLDILSHDCEANSEPSLAALVVRGDTGRPGNSFVGDPVAIKEQCYAYWRRSHASR